MIEELCTSVEVLIVIGTVEMLLRDTVALMSFAIKKRENGKLIKAVWGMDM